MMARTVLALLTVLAVAALVTVHYRATAIPASAPADPQRCARERVPNPRTEGLRALLTALLTETQAQEAGKDATCWTTVRVMDAHFAGRPIVDEVASLKIEACKTLVYHLWRRAALHAAPGQAVLRSSDIDSALPEMLRHPSEQLASASPLQGEEPVAAVMDRDYQRVTENRRYLISLTEEAILGAGLFSGRVVDLLPLTLPAADHLAACGTLLTTSFLTACGRQAELSGHGSIEADDVHTAFAAAVAGLGASDPEPGHEPPGSGPAVDAELLDCTRQMIANKITSLHAWNARIWSAVADPIENQRQYMNRFIAIPFDKAGFQELRARLVLYADYIALGITPMQRNLFAADINAHPDDFYAPATLSAERRSFADLPWTLNVLDDLFPRQIGANGDVTVTFMPMPSAARSPPGGSLVLLDYELDAVRDTTIHWSIMQEAWASPLARPADPFALEVLADRMSELALLFARACGTRAQAERVTVIGPGICDAVLHGYQFAQPPRREPSWQGDLSQEKAAISREIGTQPFSDMTVGSGFPLVRQVSRPRIGSASEGTHVDLVDYMGSGVAVGDFDGDGLPDLFLPGDGGNRLLRNLGQGRFADVTRELGITDTRCDDAHHALFVDYDNDGRLDLFIVHAHSPSRLFHQKADGHFEDVTATCGIVTGEDAHDAVWFDYDNDGLLDCYVGHYGGTRPTLDGRNGAENRLFHNLGNGHFADVTAASGLGSTGWTLATAAFDYDHDGRPDVFVANDYGRSELFHNNGDGTFTERGHAAGVDDRGSSMDASIIDIDGDGWMDLYVTQIDMFSKSIGFVFPTDKDHITVNQRILGSTFSISGDKLFRNRHDGTFEPVEEQLFEPGDRGWAWSANFFDVANAGHDDCYITNGWLDGTPAARQSHQLFIQRDGRFYLVKGGAQAYRSNARGCVAADLLGNGRMDLVVNDYGAPPHLLLNNSTSPNHWLKVALQGRHTNRFGIGAAVHVVHGQDGQWKQVSCGSNYLSQEETVLTFGLGSADHADAIEVLWPGNVLQRIPGPIAADRLSVISEGLSAPDAVHTTR